MSRLNGLPMDLVEYFRRRGLWSIMPDGSQRLADDEDHALYSKAMALIDDDVRHHAIPPSHPAGVYERTSKREEEAALAEIDEYLDLEAPTS